VYGGDRGTPLRAQLAKQRAELAAVDGQLDRLMDAMLAVDAAGTPAAFARKASELEDTQRRLQGEIAATEHQLAALARNDVDGADARWRALAKGVQELDFDARLQARQLVADTFDRIVVYASGLRPAESQADAIDVLLVAKGGAARMLRIDQSGRWVAGEDLLAA
jgi:hypothetical protein